MKKTGAQWLAQLSSDNESLAHRALLKLGSLEAKDAWMLDDLLTAFGDEEPRRFWAMTAVSCLARKKALGRHGGEVVKKLGEVAASGAAFGTRQAALSALGYCTSDAAAVVPILLRSLRDDEHGSVRAYAARALTALASKAGPDAAEALVRTIEHDPHDVARSAAAVSLKFVPLREGTVGDAIRHLQATHPDADVRSQLEVSVKRLAKLR